MSEMIISSSLDKAEKPGTTEGPWQIEGLFAVKNETYPDGLAMGATARYITDAAELEPGEEVEVIGAIVHVSKETGRLVLT